MRTYRHQPVRSSKCLNRNKIREPTGNAVKAGAGAADCEHLLMAALFSFYSFVQQSASGAVTNPPPEELRETGGPNDEVGPSPFSLLTHPSILSVRLSVRHVAPSHVSPSAPQRGRIRVLQFLHPHSNVHRSYNQLPMSLCVFIPLLAPGANISADRWDNKCEIKVNNRSTSVCVCVRVRVCVCARSSSGMLGF